MTYTSTNRGGPYRSSEARPEPEETILRAVDITTDDVDLTIHYLDEDNVKQLVSTKYAGKPTANRYRPSCPHDITKSPNKGSTEVRSWLASSFSCGCYTVDDLIIPAHRLLKITKVVTERTVNVEIG